MITPAEDDTGYDDDPPQLAELAAGLRARCMHAVAAGILDRCEVDELADSMGKRRNDHGAPGAGAHPLDHPPSAP